MKMETPFTGQLAVLGVRGRSGHLLLNGEHYTLRPGATVAHATRIGDVELHTTVIGEITSVIVKDSVLYAQGMGVSWLDSILLEGSHALSMNMDNMTTSSGHVFGQLDVISGRVSGALLVRADAYGWAGVKR